MIQTPLSHPRRPAPVVCHVPPVIPDNPNGVAVRCIDLATGKVTLRGRDQAANPMQQSDWRLAAALAGVFYSIHSQAERPPVSPALVVMWLKCSDDTNVAAELVDGLTPEDRDAIICVLQGERLGHVLRLKDGTEIAAVFSGAADPWVVAGEMLAHALTLSLEDGSDATSVLASVNDQCQDALEWMKKVDEVMDETPGKLEQQLANFQQEMVTTVASCVAEPKTQAETVLKITKGLRAVEAAIVDPHLETLVPVVLQKAPPAAYPDKQLWASIINQSCDRKGMAIRDPENQKLCTVVPAATEYASQGFFRLQEKHPKPGASRYRSRALSNIGGEVEVITVLNHDNEPTTPQKKGSRPR